MATSKINKDFLVKTYEKTGVALSAGFTRVDLGSLRIDGYRPVAISNLGSDATWSVVYGFRIDASFYSALVTCYSEYAETSIAIRYIVLYEKIS